MARFFYNLFWLPAKLIFIFFLRLEVKTSQDLKNLKGPLIVVSTHGSWIDPFLVGAAFPFNAKVFPIRYACWWKYFYFPLFTPLVLAFGSFPIKKGVGLEKALRIPVKILKKGGVVGIFPEGKKQRKLEKPARPKRGAAYLAITTKTNILPVKIEGNIGMSFFKFLARQYRIKIKIGKQFSLPPKKIEKPEDLNQPSDFIMEKVREL